MSDKQTAPWIKKLAEAIQRKYRPFSGGTEQLIEIISETFAVECRAPAPQTANYAIALDVVDAIEWIDQNEPKRARDVLAEVRDKLRAATPQVTPEKCPMCKSMTRDIRNRLYYPTEVSMCFDSWHNEGTSEQASPTPDKCPTCGHKEAETCPACKHFTFEGKCHLSACKCPNCGHSSASTQKGTTKVGEVERG